MGNPQLGTTSTAAPPHSGSLYLGDHQFFERLHVRADPQGIVIEEVEPQHQSVIWTHPRMVL